MLWFFFATLTTIFESCKDVASKHSLLQVDAYLVSWCLIVFSLPLLLPLGLIDGVPQLGEQFLLALVLGGSLNVVAWILYLQALKLGDLSLTVPLITFTPLFLLITSPIIVDEYPTLTDVMGVLLIIIGSYTLNLSAARQGYLAPIRALVSQKAPKLMLSVALIWSFTSTFDKVGIQNSNPRFWAAANYTFIALAMLPLIIYKSRCQFQQIPENLLSLLLVGLFNGLAVWFQMQAIHLTLVARVIAVKRMSALLSVILGAVIFREQGLQERSLGTVTMLLGVLLMTLF